MDTRTAADSLNPQPCSVHGLLRPAVWSIDRLANVTFTGIQKWKLSLFSRKLPVVCEIWSKERAPIGNYILQKFGTQPIFLLKKLMVLFLNTVKVTFADRFPSNVSYTEQLEIPPFEQTGEFIGISWKNGFRGNDCANHCTLQWVPGSWIMHANGLLKPQREFIGACNMQNTHQCNCSAKNERQFWSLLLVLWCVPSGGFRTTSGE